MTPDVSYDEELHQYRQNGIVVPSVTTICKILSPMPYIPPDDLEWLRVRGQMIHAATEMLEEDDLAWDMLDERIAPQVRAWQRFLEQTGFQTIHRELRVDHFRLGYAGRLDRIGYFHPQHIGPSARGPRRLAILDIKSGAPMAGAGPQTAAYAEAWNEMVRKEQASVSLFVYQRYAVELTEQGEAKLHELTNVHDFRAFEAALVINQWRNTQ